MSQRLKAIYREGVFVPQTPCDLPEEAEVELTIEEPRVIPPTVTDSNERKLILKRMTERMKANPIPSDAPRFTREELNERR